MYFRNGDAGLLSPVWAGCAVSALVDDDAWLGAMLEAEVALARAQGALGVIPASAVGPIADAADPRRLDLAALAREARGAANPVVVLVQLLTSLVAKENSGAAEFVHRGGTSQDILDTAAMLVANRAFGRIREDLSRTAGSLAALADHHRHTPMAGRTLTQHAVPITFGLKAAGWLSLVLDALDRVRRLDFPAQLGGAAGTLASYVEYARLADVAPGHGPALAARFAAELGLREPLVPWHTIRTPLADIAAVSAFVTAAVGKFALDVQVMSRTEIAEVAEPGADGRGVSSAMPQKRNPVLATLIMAAARQAPGSAMVLGQCVLAEDERSAGGWHAEWQPLRECLRLAGGAVETAAELADGLRVFPDRLRSNLELSGGAIVSERVNAALAPALGKVAAKKLLGRLACDDGKFGEALLSAPELAGILDEEAVRDLLDPSRYLGSSAALVDRVLARHRELSR
ncbi:3-carboxy-cis,cis-muconate cycloisomerase [Amycolatopsis xylanica]|uniref:3-carboxy-cis,cis-muconate cycloisomerase n=1 Tax=Amycolatopsis xylanica TaxID=589385 RepID=A0A1H3T9N4_9PSEU|nr:adenylosuccinate lyase family protein [Amycolatopsis xylanica]SDZ46578.1 3-carboxy-cis,cis-muconate cycloisomerase [Amycolatopsis xylanica]